MSAYSENYKLIEWSPIKRSEPAEKPQGPKGPFFLPDIKEFLSPLDRTLIGSRSSLREHEKRHGVRQVGELKTPADFDNSHRRTEINTDKAFDRAFHEAVQKVGL